MCKCRWGGVSVTHQTYASGSGIQPTISHNGEIHFICMIGTINESSRRTTASYWYEEDPTHIYQYWTDGKYTLNNTNTDGFTINSVNNNQVVINLGSSNGMLNTEVFIS